MRFYSVLLSSVLLASTVLADTRQHKAGVTISSPSDGTFARAEATFRLPFFSHPADSAIDIYVGLDEADGSDCSTSLKVGVTLATDSDGSVYKAWYQQTPSSRQPLNLNVSAAKTLHIGYTTLSPAHAFAEIVGTDEYVSVDIGRTCGTSVTWGLSVLPTGGGGGDDYFNVVDFGAITLTKVLASSLNAQTYHPLDRVANRFDMTNTDGAPLVTTEAGDGTVTFKFVQAR